MAELPKNIRKVGGEMVAARSPFTRRVLLPTEADLCNALGITEEEYFQFLEGVAAKVKEKPEAYGLVPEIFAGPGAGALALYQTAGGVSLTFLGQIAVGVALTAASVLLAPKPPSQRQGTNERTADIGGTKKFAPQFSFNSVQDLANLGDLIPLVFANRSQNPNGGIRVNSQLLWSQMVSLGRYQELKILALFSLGEIAKKPDFKGYAIGDLLIDIYHSNKIYKDSAGDIPFKNNGGQFEGNEENIFRIDNLRHFCGTRNPTTQATFGLSSPVPNATWYKLPFELIRTRSSFDADTRPAGRITLKKRRKLLGEWPTRAGFIAGGNASQKAGNSDVPVGTVLTYQIIGSGPLGEYTGIGYAQDAPPEDDLTMDPHGLEDVNAATKTIRETTDSYIVEGEQYMAGTAIVTCIDIDKDKADQTPGKPWDGTENREFLFKVVEPGKYDCVPNINDGLWSHCNNPHWNVAGPFFKVKDGDKKFYYEQNHNQIFDPATRYTLQKVTLGTISNNRKCHITEIGIKSKVFKQIQFANVNSKPTEDKIFEIYDHRSSIQLGNINKYVTRYSFFKLEVRPIGSDNWIWLKPSTTNHSGLFCVKGNTPEFQFNYLRIDQPAFNQYEYRFLPWPGNDVIKTVIANSSTTVVLLNANGTREVGGVQQFASNGYVVRFAGRQFHLINKQNLSNTEWNLGEPSRAVQAVATNVVTGLSSYQYSVGGASASNLPQTQELITRFNKKTASTAIVRFANYPRAGRASWFLYINSSDVTPNTQGYGPTPPYGQWPVSREVDMVTPASEIEFHYNIDPSGLGGKYMPGNLDSSSGSHQIYAVIKMEEHGVTVAPAINNLEVTLVNEDDDADGQGLKVNLSVWNANGQIFAEWEMTDTGENYSNGDVVKIPAQGSDLPDAISLTVSVSSAEKVYFDQDIAHELNAYDAAADFWKYEGDRSSHLDGPEHQITYCNEIIQTEKRIHKEGEPATYENLAYAGLQIKSSKEWTNFSQFSAYFKQGIKVKRLISDSGNNAVNNSDGVDSNGKGATNIFPEIAYALLTDKTLGAGAVISESSVDDGNMRIAAKFCKANGLFWDGMISNKVNLREFIYQQAIFSLLDFTIIGGKFSLYPAVPFNYDPVTEEGDFTINLEGKPTIKAMFTDGNINDLNVSFLPPEDRQAFKANVIYRKETENGFPEIKSKVIRLHGSDHVDDPLETFDLSGFCTNDQAARLFGEYTLALRKHLDHTVSFKTAPHYINGVRPGDYIRVFSTTQHVQRFNNGAILDDGTVVSKDTISGSKTFYYWNPSTIVAGEIMPVAEATVNFSNTNAVKAFAGSLFTIKESEASDQCYKVESITFGDDGLVELSGSYAELTSDGKLAMLQNWGSNVGNPVFDYED